VSGEAQLLALIFGFHLLAMICVAVLLLPALLDKAGSDWPIRDDGPADDGGSGNDRLPPRPDGVRPRGGLPLPDAEPARVRLRDERKLAEVLPRHERRPAREPARKPVRCDQL
jgi:hypothetical protein